MAESLIYNDLQTRITGAGNYPIICGELYDLRSELGELFNRALAMYDCLKYADCLKKALIAQRIVKSGVLVGGLLEVFSDDWQSSYGYKWNPPVEGHFWLELSEGKILDLALAGTIEAGLLIADNVGSMLKGRVPGILLGKVPGWCRYEKKIAVL